MKVTRKTLRSIFHYDTSTNLPCNIHDKQILFTCSGYKWSSHIAVVDWLASLTDNMSDKLYNLQITATRRLFSERELMFMFAICRRPSVCLSSVVCLSFVTFVHLTQAIEIFGNVSMPFGTLAICDPSVKILRRSSQGNPSVGGLNQRGVEKCNDFGPIQGYISETVQDRR